MFFLIEKYVLGMAMLRLISGMIEITAAMLMLKYNQVEKALVINSSLAIVGPIVLITTTSLGIIGIADKISFAKILWVLTGVGCIIYGVKSN
ncbi:YqhV family protein [Heyndrickxia acidiproducens]|uniref:YqhV family protein n=1 Tax=Heyndrickxia acidiproducens TaxID=1121084 RepID=UPI00036196A3|nr:YqhV family protein [Heyndrickxia acidiproducens]